MFSEMLFLFNLFLRVSKWPNATNMGPLPLTWAPVIPIWGLMPLTWGPMPPILGPMPPRWAPTTNMGPMPPKCGPMPAIWSPMPLIWAKCHQDGNPCH